MRNILCYVQKGTFSSPQIRELETSLERTYVEQFGSLEDVRIAWQEPAGRSSGVSLVRIEVDDGLDKAKRQRAVLAMANDWARIAQSSTGLLVMDLMERSTFDRYLKMNRLRRQWLGVSIVVRLLWGSFLLRSPGHDGYFAMRWNR
jgi:hypothetical protein